MLLSSVRLDSFYNFRWSTDGIEDRSRTRELGQVASFRDPAPRAREHGGARARVAGHVSRSRNRGDPGAVTHFCVSFRYKREYGA